MTQEQSFMKALQVKQAYEEALGFKFETSFYEGFSVAEYYGPKGVLEYFEEAFDQWKDNVKYLTELVLTLNLKINQWYGVNDTLGLLYNSLWVETDAFAMESLKGDKEALHYYLSTLD